MRLTIPVLVGVDDRDRYHVQAATLPSRRFSGPSLTELLDDLALHLMETVPGSGPGFLERTLFCHDTQLRRVKVDATIELAGESVAFTGRISAVAQRWPGQELYLVAIPRLSSERFPVRSLSHLGSAMVEMITALGAAGTNATTLAGAVCRRDEHLEVVEVDVDLPTVLSSRTPTRRRPTSAHPATPASRSGRTWVAPTTLRSIAVSLGHRALDGGLRRAFGRDGLVEQIVREMERPGAAVLLVGPHGVGKTAIIHEVVRRMVDPHATLTERVDFWQLDGNRLIAGMMYVGAWEARTESMVQELAGRDDVLVVDDLPTFVYTGRSAHSDTNVAGFLEPHLARRAFRILGECTMERLAASRDEAPGFFQRFRVLQVPPLDERRTLLVQQRIARELEADRDQHIRGDALLSVLAFNRRFQANQCQPGAAVGLLRRVVDDAVATKRDAVNRPVIDAGAALTAIRHLTGLPEFVLDPTFAREPSEIRAWFEERVLAQPNATEAVVDVVCTLQQGLQDPGRPIATMLLVGPTGVGKTETAKALAAWLFGSPDRLVRFDMSEFRSVDSVARLIGDVTHPDGELTRRVAHQPFCVVLFDEIEKAHPALFDVLLQVMGEGRLTNAVGRTTDFTSTIVLLTSNLGVAEARQSVGFTSRSASAEDAHFRRAAEQFFRPEFVNRLDRVVAFRTLEREHVGALVQRLVRQLLTRRGLLSAGVLVQVDPTVVDFIVDEGFDAAFGARALKRTLERRLTVPLARELLGRPPGALAHVDVFPVLDSLELALTPLVPRTDWVERPPVPDDVAALRTLHATLTERLDALRETRGWHDASTARAELLEQIQTGADARDASFDALHELAELAQSAQELVEQLDDLGQDHLGSFRFQEAIEHEVHGIALERYLTIKRPVLTEQPIPIDARQERAHVRRELSRMVTDIAVLTYRLAQLSQPLDSVLVRVLPDTPDSADWAVKIGMAFARAWGPWGRVERLRHADGAWHPHDDVVSRKSSGEALVLHVRGLRRLVEPVAGYALYTQQLGPDRVVRLARVEVLPSSPHAPRVVLQELDEAWHAFRDARRSGATAPSPRPPLEVSLQCDDSSDVTRQIRERGLLELESSPTGGDRD